MTFMCLKTKKLDTEKHTRAEVTLNPRICLFSQPSHNNYAFRGSAHHNCREIGHGN